MQAEDERSRPFTCGTSGGREREIETILSFAVCIEASWEKPLSTSATSFHRMDTDSKKWAARVKLSTACLKRPNLCCILPRASQATAVDRASTT